MAAKNDSSIERIVRYWAGRLVLLVLGLIPVSCHYELTGPALWAHHSSYAFEAWLVMWIVSIVIAAVAIYASFSD